MKIIHRCDGGGQLGMGHVARNLILADELSNRGHFSCFATKKMDMVAVQAIASRGFEVRLLSDEISSDEEVDAIRDADLAILDSYSLSESTLKKIPGHTLYFSDFLQPFHLPVSFLLNPHPGSERLSYNISKYCRRLLGSQYIFIRQQIKEAKRLAIRKKIAKIGITCGASDPTDLTMLAARGAKHCGDLEWHIILGPSYEATGAGRTRALEEFLSRIGVTYRLYPFLETRRFVNWAFEMDAAIASTSSTVYELLSLGTPIIGITANHSQKLLGEGLADAGAIHYLGEHSAVTPQIICGAIDRLRSPVTREALVSVGKHICDGEGSRRVADELEKHLCAGTPS